MRLASVISRIEKHRRRAVELGGRDLSDEVLFNAVAMECFQAVNSALELGELIVSEKNIGFPSNYREIFELLYKAKIIGGKTLDKIKRLIFLRNLISHEYHSITEDELREMVGLMGSLGELAESAKGSR